MVAREPNQPLPFGRQYGESTSPPAIFWASLFTPTRLGRQLPAYPDASAGILYSLMVKGVPLMGCAVVLAIVNSGNGAPMFIGFAVAALIASAFCEACIAVQLKGFVAVANVSRPDRYRLWGTLCLCFSTHLGRSISLMAVSIFILAWTGVADPSCDD